MPAHRLLSQALRKINAALKDRRIRGYLSETLATLEGVQKAQRGAYFAKVQPKIRSTPEQLPDGRIKVGITLQPDDSLHPGLHPIVAKWITAATSLGLRFLYAPRIGAPRPSELLSDVNFAIEATDKERTAGKMGFGLLGGQCSHTNELGVASTISSRLRLRRLKIMGREQVAHFGQGLYMAAPCAYCSRTQRVVFSEP